MKLQKLGLAQGLIFGALGLCGLAAGCKDDDPCDPGQIVRNALCYPAPASAGATSSGGASAGGAPDAVGGAPDAVGGAPSADTAFGTACEDTKASSDCGGVAPICADLSKLGQTIMCTQINCSAGEANAGVCPSGFTCFAISGYPSVCIKS